MIKLTNSAIIPQPGTYHARQITKEEFIALVQRASEQNFLESYIGYQQNVELIRKWTGVSVALNRAETKLESGDAMLVMKLKYRVADPSTKGAQVNEDDFEFYLIGYSRE